MDRGGEPHREYEQVWGSGAAERGLVSGSSVAALCLGRREGPSPLRVCALLPGWWGECQRDLPTSASFSNSFTGQGAVFRGVCPEPHPQYYFHSFTASSPRIPSWDMSPTRTACLPPGPQHVFKKCAS